MLEARRYAGDWRFPCPLCDAAHPPIRCSMGSVGDCYDNAMAESFFATLECELLARQPFPTHVAARTALFEYIEVFYNRQRRHSALGYLSPDAYERRWSTQTPVVA
jgi:putative transposase